MNGLKLTILLLSMLTMMAAAIIAPGLPDIAIEFQDFPKVELLSKLILSLPALMIAIVAPFAGNYIDRFGRLQILYIALIGYALSGISGYFFNDLYLILLGRMFLGIFIGVIMTTTMTLVGDFFEGEERQKFVGIQSAFIGFAGVLFMSIGGYLAMINWRLPFLIYLFSLLIIPLIFIYLEEPDRSNHLLGNIRLPSSKLLTFLFPIGTFFMILFYMMPTQLPFLLKHIGITNNSNAGIALAVNALGIVCSSIFYSNIKNRFSFLQVAVLGLTVMGMGYFFTGVSIEFSTVLFMVFVAGLGLGLFIANLSFWVLQLSSIKDRGKSMGILTAGLFMGQFLSPIVAEPVVQYSSLAGLFKSSIVLMLLMGGSLALAVRFLGEKR